jgi:Excreted virulence factor EspC, type VII ESX diderm
VSNRVTADPEQLAQVSSAMVALADQVHGSVTTADESAAWTAAGPNAGFATAGATSALWPAWRSALLATGTRVAQFGDDLAASGAAWRRQDDLAAGELAGQTGTR